MAAQVSKVRAAWDRADACHFDPLASDLRFSRVRDIGLEAAPEVGG